MKQAKISAKYDDEADSSQQIRSDIGKEV